jgi:hypothetical protein
MKLLASLSRKTTSLRFGKLRPGTQLMAPGGPVFALMSYASAGDSGRKTTSLRFGKLRPGTQLMAIAGKAVVTTDNMRQGQI